MENNEKVQEFGNKEDLLFELQQIDMINGAKYVDEEMLADITLGSGGILTIICC